MSTYTGSIYAVVILYCFSMSRLIASCDEVSRLIEAGKSSQSQSASATIQQWDIVRIKYIYTYIFKFGSLSSATCRQLNVTAFGHFVNSSEIFINFVFKLQHTHTTHTHTHTTHTQKYLYVLIAWQTSWKLVCCLMLTNCMQFITGSLKINSNCDVDVDCDVDSDDSVGGIFCLTCILNSSSSSLSSCCCFVANWQL